MADGEGKKGKSRPYWLPFVIAFAMLMILTFIFFFRPDLMDHTRFTFTEWVTIGNLVAGMMLIWLLVWKITLNTEVTAEVVAAAAAAEEAEKRPKKRPKPAPEEMEAEEPPERPPTKPKKKRVVVAAGTAAGLVGHDDELPEGLKRPEDVIDEDIADMEGMPRVVEYPDKEPGGVYSDTLLKVDEGLVLNFRILLGKVCHNCEELEDCKRRVEGKLDEDVFLYNFECKDGIKAELNKARKKREAEEDKADTAKRMVEEKAAEAKEEEPAGEEPPKKAPAKKTTTSKGTKKKSSSSSTKKKGSGAKK